MAVIFIPAPLRRLTGGRSRIDVAASSVDELFDRLEAEFPGMRSYLLDEGGALKAYVNVFVNAAEIRALAGLQTPLAPGDEVSIIPAMAGGARGRAMRPGPIATADARQGAPVLPDLRIVPAAALLLHEECDPERVERLAKRLEAEGVLRNPPVVAPLDAQSFVVLDGANRVTALQRVGVLHQVVQVIDYDDPAVVLEVWAHLLQQDGAILRGVAAWQQTSPEAVREGLEQGTFVCGLVTVDGTWGAPAAGDLAGQVRALVGIVATYKGRAPIYRVQGGDFPGLARAFGAAEALVLFPTLTKADIRAIARLAVKLPTGISRHVVPLRALRVNVDLALLRADEPTAAKQAGLDDLIRGRLLEHRVRHYPEPTVLYDE